MIMLNWYTEETPCLSTLHQHYADIPLKGGDAIALHAAQPILTAVPDRKEESVRRHMQHVHVTIEEKK